MSLKQIRPPVVLANEHLQRLHTSLKDIEAAIDDNDRSLVIGSLMVALDNIALIQPLVQAALLLAKDEPRTSRRKIG